MSTTDQPPADFATRAQRALTAIFFLVMALVLAGIVGVAAYRWKEHGVAVVPYGLETRAVWTTSRVVGTPEPPDPYIVRRAFPKLTFQNPLDVAFMPGSDRVAVAEQTGKIYTFHNEAGVAKADLMFDANQTGVFAKLPKYQNLNILGFTFDPNYPQNHFVYVNYVGYFFPWLPAPEYERANPDNKTASRVSRFVVSESDPPVVDLKSELLILAWQGNGHNGCCLKFGPDGDLYISTGDNGNPNPPDPFDVAQNVGDLRSKILRLDVSHATSEKPYEIPADNPFVSTPGARGEVFAYGLRNPWRMSFDRAAGGLWVGDVGWELWESVQHVKAGTNCGWSIIESKQPVHPNGKRGPTPIKPPDAALPHTEAASITGGYVYHGKQLSGLAGQYLFGDWETRRIWAAPCDGETLAPYKLIAQTQLRVVAWGEDKDGELLIVDHEKGGLWKLAPNPALDQVNLFPRKLSQSGLFADLAAQKPNVGVLPYTINAPQWVDGSTSVRFVAVPSSDPTKLIDGKFIYPPNTVFVRTLSLPMVAGDSSSARKIETQLLHFDGHQWHAYAYAWNNEQTDADLVEPGGRDAVLTIADPAAPGARRQQLWHFNSRAQCLTCHTEWNSYAMGFSVPELDRLEHYQTASHGAVEDNELRSLRHIGLVPPEPVPDPPKPGEPPPKPVPPVVLVDPYEENSAHSLDDRARSYLHVNCSVCHRFGGGGTALIEVIKDKELRDTHLLSTPMLGAFNIPDARIVCPGDPSRSVLLYRMAKSGTGRMPHLGSTQLDEKGIDLLARWITSLKDDDGSAAVETDHQSGVAQDAALAALQGQIAPDSAKTAVDTLVHDSRGGMKLALALQEGRISQALRPLVLQWAMAAPDPNVHDLFASYSNEPIRPKIGPSPTDEQIASLLKLSGDADRGHKIFTETAGGLCSKCHIVDGNGADFGPDLSKIGAKYNKADLLDNIIHPAKTIAQGYEAHVVRTKAGEQISGFLISESDAEIVIKNAERKLIHIPRETIDKSVVQQGVSFMPDGIIADLEPQQVADLLEYLANRK